MGAIDKHGCTASIWVHPNFRDTVVCEKSALLNINEGTFMHNNSKLEQGYNRKNAKKMKINKVNWN